MALNERQKEIAIFAEKGFKNSAGLYPTYTTPKTTEWQGIIYGIKDIGVGRCAWAKFMDNNIQINISVSRYGEVQKDGSFEADELRDMFLRFKDCRAEIPRINIRFCGGTLDTLVEDLENTKKFIAATEQAAYKAKYGCGTPIVIALRENFPGGHKLCHVGNHSTYIGRFQNGYPEGVYLSVPFSYLAGPQYGRLRKTAHVATKTLERLLKAKK